jgi:ribosomal protein S18 acetylase RimI-like enzyme
VIRRATRTDHGWIRALAADVYRELGDYWTILGSWLDHAGVAAYVDESGEDVAPDRRGFTLVGFHAIPDAPPGRRVVDLLAIAVARPHQRRGLGRALLDHAVSLGEIAAEHGAAHEMRLSVSETNPAGQRLFAAAGFVVLDEDHGRYAGGQRAIRMRRELGAASVAALVTRRATAQPAASAAGGRGRPAATNPRT